MQVRLDRAHGHTRCAECDQPIHEGTARVWELRYASVQYHVDCAVEARPELVRNTLLAHQEVDPALVPDRNALLDRVRARLAAIGAERRAAAMPDADALLDPLFAQLEDDPDDRGVLAVIADALSDRGDVRGELITADLAAEARPQAPLPARRRDELRIALAPAFGDIPHAITWGVGFIRRLEVQPLTAPRTARLADVWKHPSMRVLVELALTGAAGPLMYAWFPALRRLQLTSGSTPVGAVGEIVAAMPRLTSLALAGLIERIDLSHASLTELRVDRSLEHVLHELDPARLPKLVRLTTVGTFHASLEVLLRAGWGARLQCLALHDTVIDAAFPALLEAALAGRRLAHLDLSESTLNCSARALRPLCEQLTARIQPMVGMSVRHRDKPEWGTGVVTGWTPGKVEIAFAAGGKKTLRDTLPALVFDD